MKAEDIPSLIANEIISSFYEGYEPRDVFSEIRESFDVTRTGPGEAIVTENATGDRYRLTADVTKDCVPRIRIDRIRQ